MEKLVLMLKKNDFDHPMACEAPVRWWKYTIALTKKEEKIN